MDGFYKKTTMEAGLPKVGADGHVMTEDANTRYLALSLPLGFAWDLLPSSWGLHGQVNFLDLAQYVSVSTDGQVAKTTLATAVNLGATFGVTLASKTTPVLIAGSAGWAPGLKIGTDANHAGQFSLAAMVGTYVPLADLN